jgi:pSer/pThr/pTyr-binding forkhead associated (FHA) protein
MGRNDRCMLFAPPNPPLRLDPEREVVIGRSRSCELTLQADQASRRHALVRFEDDHFRVRDLGSTNGTFVNGESLDAERVLRPGDRIEIGGTLVTFCLVDEAMEDAMHDMGEGETILMTRPLSGAREALRGNFEEIPSFAVLQILEMGSQTGLLSVEGGEGAGSMWLENGRLIHAETEKTEGFEAATEIVQSASGRFLFEPGGEPLSRTLNASVTEVILEATRLLDESSARSGC